MECVIFWGSLECVRAWSGLMCVRFRSGLECVGLGFQPSGSPGSAPVQMYSKDGRCEGPGLPAGGESRASTRADVRQRWEVRGAWTPSGLGVQGLDSQWAGSPGPVPGQMCGKDGRCRGPGLPAGWESRADVRQRWHVCGKDGKCAGKMQAGRNVHQR